jgi:hypothetical protein
MSLNKDQEESQFYSDVNYDEMDETTLNHKKYVRRMLEERLERKRLKAELDDELEGEFDWDDLEN